MILTYVSIENLNFQLMKTSNLTDNFEKDSDLRKRFDKLENLNISESHNILNTIRIFLIFDTLKCAWKALQFQFISYVQCIVNDDERKCKSFDVRILKSWLPDRARNFQ